MNRRGEIFCIYLKRLRVGKFFIYGAYREISLFLTYKELDEFGIAESVKGSFV